MEKARAEIAEVWLRGPLPGIDPQLQPAAHSLLQVVEELPRELAGLADDDLWARPGKSASIGYHLAHLTGSLDRLTTYARGEALNPTQFAALEAERKVAELRPPLADLLAAFATTAERVLEQLRNTSADSLTLVRSVGRKKLPATTLGLLMHAAEHTARHHGQIVTLLRVLQR
jgi:uncharacterized damage-inducible protein DinB